MNYEFNLLHHVGVVDKRLFAAPAEHEGDNNTFGPKGQRGETRSDTIPRRHENTGWTI